MTKTGGRAAQDLDVALPRGPGLAGGDDVASSIRQESVGNLALEIAAYAAVRAALLERQRAFRRLRVWSPTAATWARWSFPTPPQDFLVADVRRQGRAAL